MKEELLNKSIEAIKKTGFVLEFQVDSILRKNGWNTINNRYYLDDIQNKPREIDILAYKVTTADKVRYYNILIISCKKSENHKWAFCTKPLPKKDANFNYYPLLTWTNDPWLNFMLNEIDLEQQLKSLSKNQTFGTIYGLSSQIFAFQELKFTNENITSVNDTAIFESINTLIKSLAYERNLLNERIDVKSFYCFYLLSIADTDFIELHFNDMNEIEPKTIDNINYVNRFIVRNKDEFFKINFVTSKTFELFLESLNKVQEWNKEYFPDLRKQFMRDILVRTDYLSFQFDNTIQKLINDIGYIFHAYTNKEIKREFFESIEYHKGTNHIKINMAINSEDLEAFSSKKSVLIKTRNWLKIYYNFEGTFSFEIVLPF